MTMMMSWNSKTSLMNWMSLESGEGAWENGLGTLTGVDASNHHAQHLSKDQRGSPWQSRSQTWDVMVVEVVAGGECSPWT